MTADSEAPEFDIDDPSYRACYVFQPESTSGDVDDGRPRKKRKIASKDEEVSITAWPRLCNGQEPPELATARQNRFRDLWARQQSRLQSIADEVDQTSLDRIASYLLKTGTHDGKLRTAIVVCGSNGKNLRHLLSQQPSTSPHTVYCELQSTQATNLQTALKALIRSAVVSHGGNQAYALHLAANKRRIPMPFDLELLQDYLAKNHLNKVILSIPDAETFGLNILSELLSNFTSWKDRIPFVIVLSLATTVNLFESRMSKSTISLLDTEVFSLTSIKDKFFELFSSTQLCEGDSDQGPPISALFSPVVANSLYEMSQDQSVTPHAFAQAIKYCLMTHFFSNSLSALLGVIDAGTDTSVLSEAIRNTVSFQKHCTAILDGQIPQIGPDVVQRLLSSDTELVDYSQEQLQETYATLRQGESILHLLAVVCHRLEPSTTPFKHYHRLLTDYRRNNLEDSEACGLIVSILPTLSAASVAELFDEISPFIPRTNTASLKLLMNDPPTTPAPLVTALTTLLQTLQTPSTTPYLSEAILITRTQLATNFLPRPRFAISRALASPTDYLGCECCTARGNNKGTDPTAILYQLLDEAGREINVMDLWTTFRDNIFSDSSNIAVPSAATTKGAGAKCKNKTKTVNGTASPAASKAATAAAAKSKGKAKFSSTHDDDDDVGNTNETNEETTTTTERQALSLFYTALAELKYLGLVKSTSDRRLNKGVEVLSKVSWHGL